MALSIGILADDLTGALGSAARLHATGLRTEVRWSRAALSPATEALVVNMRTRDHDREPRETARQCAAWLREEGCRRVELRLDSTLRGQPEVELSGLLDGARLDEAWIVVVPAFPDAERVTLNGRQRAALGPDGTPLNVDVGARIFGRANFTCIELGLVEEGPRAVARALMSAAEGGVSRFVIDGARDEHLAAAAEAVAAVESAGQQVVTVSPGGWLRYRGVPGGVVVVTVATSTAVSRQQLAVLEAEPNVLLIDATGESAIPPVPPTTLAVVVETRRGGEEATLRWLAHRAANATVDLLIALRSTGRRVKGVIASGGHTASALVDALGIDVLVPDDELAPLCPKGRVVGGSWSGLTVVTKGGLIGGPTTLSELVHALA